MVENKEKEVHTACKMVVCTVNMVDLMVVMKRTAWLSALL